MTLYNHAKIHEKHKKTKDAQPTKPTNTRANERGKEDGRRKEEVEL